MYTKMSFFFFFFFFFFINFLLLDLNMNFILIGNAFIMISITICFEGTHFDG